MNKHKEKIMNKNINSAPSLFDDNVLEKMPVERAGKVVNIKKTSKKEMIRFYITEMTGLTEEEFNEHFIDGKKAKEKKDVSEAVKSAVEFKLRCEVEDITNSNIKINSNKSS